MAIESVASTLKALKYGYEIGKTLFSKGSAPFASYSIERARALMAHAQEAYRNPYVIDFLKWKYPTASLLSAAGGKYPVAIFESAHFQQSDPESILRKPLRKGRQRDGDLLPQSATYRSFAHRLGLEHYDRPCFTMGRIESSSHVELDCELGSYLRALDTCDELAWELLCEHKYLSGVSTKDFKEFDRRLPLRARLHAAVDDPLVYGQRRSAAIAVSTLIAFYDGETLTLLMKRRSGTVAVHSRMVHVVPSFMFQPATPHLDEEFSIVHNFEREYLEELFGRAEPEESEGDWQYFYEDPRLQFLRTLLSNGGAALFLSGLAINLLNLRPEVCLLLLIRDPHWYEHHRRNKDERLRFNFNNEWLRLGDMKDNPHQAVGLVRYHRDGRKLMADANLKSSDLVPPGAAALWMGKKLLDEMMP